MGRLQANSNLSKDNKISINKQNLGGGKLSLFEFDNPKNISNIQLWTKQGSLTDTFHYTPFWLNFIANYDGGDIDTNFYLDNNSSYLGDEFGFYISYSVFHGLWYLYDVNDNDYGYAQSLFGPWTTYNDLNNFEINDYDYISSTQGTVKYVWSDVSGKNNNLTTRKDPSNQGIISSTIKGLEAKLLKTPFETTNTINAFLPFTIYIVLVDQYLGNATRNILGITNGPNQILYLQSTSTTPVGGFHTFTLYIFGSPFAIFSVSKTVFSSYRPSILKISSNYQTNPASPIRDVTCSYYNEFPGSDAFRSVTASFQQGVGNLFLGHNNFGGGLPYPPAAGVIPSDLYLSEVLVYDKSLSTEEDGLINRYLQRKYYGRLIP
jgi:hypothetical protein